MTANYPLYASNFIRDGSGNITQIRPQRHHTGKRSRTAADVKGTINVKGSGWLVLRAWNEEAHLDISDLYPYASTNPIYINAATKNNQQTKAAEYFIKWINRIEIKANELPYRNQAEKDAVMNDIKEAKLFYQKLLK